MKKLIPLLLLLSFSIKAQDVKIGKQTWTTKNLDVSTYRNGDAIPQVQDNAAWADLTTGAWCYYENKPANGTKYGKLYNWYAVNDPRGLAPKGYHIPGDKEWTNLTDYLGGDSLAGLKMRSGRGWENNSNGTNSIGFAGLPSGSREVLGDFYGVGAQTFWWSSSEHIVKTSDPFFGAAAWCRFIWSDNGGNVTSDHSFKTLGMSVRCLRDGGSDNKPEDGSTTATSVAEGETTAKLVDEAEVRIGTQVWTTKNLDVTKYRNGDTIPQAQDKTAWANLTTGAWCYYKKNKANYDSIGAIYGKLYNWYAVNDPRGLAPKGYHIPSDAEWNILTDYLGGDSLAGSKMRSTSGWRINRNGTNTSGFAGLPGGLRYDRGLFGGIDFDGSWWSSSERQTSDGEGGEGGETTGSGINIFAWCRFSPSNNGGTGTSKNNKHYGFSVRCLRD